VQRWRRRFGNLADQLGLIPAYKGRPQRQHLVQRHRQRVDIATDVRLALEPLRRHVAHGTNDVARARQVATVIGLGQSEVGDPQCAVRVQEQVRRLDVAVQHALAVGVRQSLGRLKAELGNAPEVASLRLAADAGLTRRRGSRGRGSWDILHRDHGGRLNELAGKETAGDALIARGLACGLILRRRCDAAQSLHIFQDHLKALAVDELHGVVATAVLFADAINRDNVGMVQPGRRSRFALKALQVKRPAGLRRQQHLESHMPAQRFLHRLVHHSHAAPAHDPEQQIITQPAGRVGPLPGRDRFRLCSNGAKLFDHGQRREGFADAGGPVPDSARCIRLPRGVHRADSA
jgi:hypothetical protein